jgi:LPS sulfotransferase NodH
MLNESQLASFLRYAPEELKDERERYVGCGFRSLTHYESDAHLGLEKYVLATTARVGGHWLGQILFGLGCDQPHEWLSDYHLRKFAEANREDGAHGANLNSYWAHLFSEAKASNARKHSFGIKINLLSLLPLLTANAFPGGLKDWKWIYLYREDVIAQGISLYVAQKCNAWNWFEGQERINDLKDHECNLDELLNAVQIVANERLRWDLFFALFGITPLRVSYEDLMRDALMPARRVIKHLDFRNEDLVFRDFVPLVKQETPVYTELRGKITASFFS